MTHVTKIFAIAVLLCAWPGASYKSFADGASYKSFADGTSYQIFDDDYCSYWAYGENEKMWPVCWPCTSPDQSPVDIRRDEAKPYDFPPLGGTFYDERNTPFRFSIANNNYTVKVQLVGGEDLYLKGGPLRGRYYLDHLNFVWGSDNEHGSEHTLAGRRSVMEVQWGLYSECFKKYKNGAIYPYGILRIGILMDVVEEDNPSLAPIVAALPSVREPDQRASPEEPIVYNSLLPDRIEDYYAYNGSLTTPPCRRPVNWLIYFSGQGISQSQLNEFRKLRTTNGPMVDNYRHTQFEPRWLKTSSKNSFLQQ